MTVTFANQLSKSPAIRAAMVAFDAGHGEYEAGMHFGVDGAEYAFGVFADATGTGYGLVASWDGERLAPVDHDLGLALVGLVGQIMRRGDAS